MVKESRNVHIVGDGFNCDGGNGGGRRSLWSASEFISRKYYSIENNRKNTFEPYCVNGVDWCYENGMVGLACSALVFITPAEVYIIVYVV